MDRLVNLITVFSEKTVVNNDASGSPNLMGVILNRMVVFGCVLMQINGDVVEITSVQISNESGVVERIMEKVDVHEAVKVV